MRKQIYIIMFLIALFAIIGVSWFLIQSTDKSSNVESDFNPEIIKIETAKVQIAWTSKRPYSGTICFKPEGSGEDAEKVAESLGKVTYHEVSLNGLQPGMRYSYWLEGFETEYQFQTAPTVNSPYSFLVTWNEADSDQLPIAMRSFSEFIISLSLVDSENSSAFKNVRSYMPVYDSAGLDSPYLKSLEIYAESKESQQGWILDQGGLHLVFPSTKKDLLSLLSSPGSHTCGLILKGDLIGNFNENNDFTAPVVQDKELHGILKKYNSENPALPVSFVFIPGSVKNVISVDGIQYLGIDVAAPEYSAIRIDVNPESLRATFLNNGKQVTLKEAPLKEKRTCSECRRLADKGAYDESIKAYREFIKNHQGHFQIDDAYFAIAEILDSKLFKFKDALEAYQKLIEIFPESSLVPIAKQRISYLQKYRDHDYIPFARFEEFKVKLFSSRSRDEERVVLLEKAGKIIEEFPNASISPIIQHWIANQYSQLDPDRAAAEYRQLIRKYKDYAGVDEALLQIAETYYNNQRYSECLLSCEEALVQWKGENNITVKLLMMRSQRNLNRRSLAIASGVLLLLICCFGLFIRPVGVSLRKFKAVIGVFITLFVVFLFGGWLVYEQFSSTGEMVKIAIAFALSSSAGLPFSLAIAEKISFPKIRFSAQIISGVTGIVLFSSGICLSIYLINPHYFIAVGI